MYKYERGSGGHDEFIFIVRSVKLNYKSVVNFGITPTIYIMTTTSTLCKSNCKYASTITTLFVMCAVVFQIIIVVYVASKLATHSHLGLFLVCCAGVLGVIAYCMFSSYCSDPHGNETKDDANHPELQT
jgi:hypothetical protein